MKTAIQIEQKAEKLKAKLRKMPIKENFGDKEQRQLDDFIGHIYNYHCEIRQRIENISNAFFNWCINYTV